MNPLFGDKSQVPDDYALIQALGSSESLRLDLISFLESTYGPVVTEWKFYGKGSGWIRMSNGVANLIQCVFPV
ncbi:MAG: hypothetical protein BWY82_02085 [Verrucomicrobia bacterium ADurb.Bin474]|nr:MAG: hypothetical protein BWY82_02085 [Verrucomicrobia bacterium ADurb.Bin474]